ncbi:MAG: hypothetical protein HYX75_23355 [Acidobacteria bacterium]|nr:hypothetical protein [Acidobacteriota bacterium]
MFSYGAFPIVQPGSRFPQLWSCATQPASRTSWWSGVVTAGWCRSWTRLPAAVAVVLPVASQLIVGEQDMRVRAHNGAIGRFYLDSLLGFSALRAHGAERAMTVEHEARLTEWTRASSQLLKTKLGSLSLQSVVAYGLAIAILSHLIT